MMNGFAYVFLRRNGAPLPPGCAGHVGWGFLLTEATAGAQTGPGNSGSTFYCGATENNSGSPIVLPGGKTDWWGKSVGSEADMVAAFEALDYDAYKVASVRNCDPAQAYDTAKASGTWGYEALGNNCLDHVWRILKAYGVDGLPLAQAHPSPGNWFGAFNGEFHNIIPSSTGS